MIYFIYMGFCKKPKKFIKMRTVVNLGALLSGISMLVFLSKNAYPVVYVVPPDIDMYMHQTNDVYKTLIENLCGAGNNGQGIIKDCFKSLTAYTNSAASYSFTPLANPNINNLSTTIGNANIISSTVAFSSVTNSAMGSSTYCFPIGNSSTCFSIEDYTTMQYQTVLLSASYANGQLVSGSSGTVWMPSCTYHTGNSALYAEFIVFAPTSCSYDFLNPGSQNNVVASKVACPSGDSASTCYTISASCFFGSNTNSSTVSGLYYTNLPVLSFCPTWSES
ncbi:MAG: hypothetical protein ACP5S8_01165 [Hydrogenobaculum sp.]